MQFQRTVTVCLLLGSVASAQAFWTRERRMETEIYAGAIALDSWESSRTNAPELNPLARPFVNHGATRQAIGASIGFAAGVLPSYLLHRSGHERMSRTWLRTCTAGETLNALHMLYRFH